MVSAINCDKCKYSYLLPLKVGNSNLLSLKEKIELNVGWHFICIVVWQNSFTKTSLYGIRNNVFPTI